MLFGCCCVPLKSITLMGNAILVPVAPTLLFIKTHHAAIAMNWTSVTHNKGIEP